MPENKSYEIDPSRSTRVHFDENHVGDHFVRPEGENVDIYKTPDANISGRKLEALGINALDDKFEVNDEILEDESLVDGGVIDEIDEEMLREGRHEIPRRRVLARPQVSVVEPQHTGRPR